MAKKKQDVAAEVEQTVNPVAPVEEMAKVLLDFEQEVALERELRRYDKRAGGFRKGISEEGKKKAKQIMKRLGRKEKKWDVTILVPGFETPEA